MAPQTWDALEALSAKIKAEESSSLAVKCAADQQADREPCNLRRELDEAKYAGILLRSLRIHLCLSHMDRGQPSCLTLFHEDWRKILEYVSFLEYQWEITEDVIADAIDLILLPQPHHRPQLLAQLPREIGQKQISHTHLRSDVFLIGTEMVQYCLSQEMPDRACTIIRSLVALSEERNCNHPELHRENVRCGLWYIVDISHELTCWIGDQQKRYFEGVSDYDASRFYWFYSFALAGVGRYEEAAALSRHCWEMCLALEGQNSWIGARAGQMYHLSFLQEDQTGQAEAFLWDFIQKIDEGEYPEMDETAPFVRAVALSELLGVLMERQALRSHLPQIRSFLEYCASLGDAAPNPRLTLRYAENMLSAYYLELGDYLQAADHCQKALEAIPPKGLPKIPSDALLYTNQLLVYTALNDFDQMMRLMQLLSNCTEEYENDDYTMSRALLMMNAAAKKLGIYEDGLDDDRQTLSEIYQDLRDGQLPVFPSAVENRTYAQWVLDMVSGILDTFRADREELIVLNEIITYFLDRPESYIFIPAQIGAIYLLRTQVQWQLQDPQVLVSLEKALEYSAAITSSYEARISILRFAALVYYDYGHAQKALEIIQDALNGITDAWHKATAYLNNHKVCQLLSYVQLYFNVCYSILRTGADSETLYDAVLRFKALSVLVGRERNRLLRLAPVDQELQQRIFTVQDQLAAAEMNDSLAGTATAQALFVQLQALEAQFAAQFPENLNFTDIRFQRVCEALPQGCAIVEYWFATDAQAVVGQVSMEENWELEIFVTANNGGQVAFHHIRKTAGTEIAANARRFLELLQDFQAAIVHGTEKERLRHSLYWELIGPVLPCLEGIHTLYLAPDEALINLPFEILCPEDGKSLQDQYRLCRLVCGRDILFHDDAPDQPGDCFILGDPDFEAVRGERSDSLLRGTQMSLSPVSPLPFSGVEAASVARICKTRPYTGTAATKYALQLALPCRIIHLATHGVFDQQMETDSLYSSHLVFSGYNKWIREKQESAGCGNGVLTADEISRMDLHETALVVLSACQSGLGSTSYGSTQGLMSAFSAAGVRWIVSHMWHASDFATPVLMDAFYRAHLNLGLEVPQALRYAKNYLRCVTVGELRRNGWLETPGESRLSQDSMAAIMALRNANDRRKPFSDEFYWGGFVVHKSR